MKIFRDLNDEGATILMVTHEPHISLYTKRIVRFMDGEIVGSDEVKERKNL